MGRKKVSNKESKTFFQFLNCKLILKALFES
ncbi:hypothetical protein LNTAR_02769 [Lentisphaera araneosa HTCC2155]|uniref:Uncharacterized protein n=1 Tax=Lentisphaera araneosa HTCC2155 TaxID=313628 RepID=A6DTB6_9BACT|nr:hypothetical protein LNTAR_02769 [Lentisphaera araneosa HTCC2155]